MNNERDEVRENSTDLEASHAEEEKEEEALDPKEEARRKESMVMRGRVEKARDKGRAYLEKAEYVAGMVARQVMSGQANIAIPDLGDNVLTKVAEAVKSSIATLYADAEAKGHTPLSSATEKFFMGHARNIAKNVVINGFEGDDQWIMASIGSERDVKRQDNLQLLRAYLAEKHPGLKDRLFKAEGVRGVSAPKDQGNMASEAESRMPEILNTVAELDENSSGGGTGTPGSE